MSPRAGGAAVTGGGVGVGAPMAETIYGNVGMMP